LNCTRPLDALDLEALASGESPILVADASEHAAACLDCGRRLDAFRALGEWLSDVSIPPVPEGLADRVERLRGFTRREARSWRVWRPPLLASAGLLAASATLLSLPAFSAGEQAGLLGALSLEWRTLLLWPASLLRSLPATAGALSDLLLRDRGFAALSILLMLPAGFGVTRLWARHAIGK
jgi:hypothetical protein